MRHTIKDVRNMVDRLNRLTGKDFGVDKPYSARYRLVVNKGDRNVSPSMPVGKLYQWIYAFSEGIEYATKVEKETIPPVKPHIVVLRVKETGEFLAKFDTREQAENYASNEMKPGRSLSDVSRDEVVFSEEPVKL